MVGDAKLAVSGLQQSLVQRRQIFAGRRRDRGRGAGRRRTKLSSPSPITASVFPPPISIGCSSAITAAATFPVSSEPVSVFTWSRSRSTCTAAASRWRARKATARASSFVCRLSAHRRTTCGRPTNRTPHGARRPINRNFVGQHPMKTFVVTLTLFLRSPDRLRTSPPAVAAPVVLPVGRVQVDWQGPLSLPRRFRNHCAVDVLTGRLYCSDHCGFNYQFYYCSNQSFGCCRVGYGYCDWRGCCAALRERDASPCAI